MITETAAAQIDSLADPEALAEALGEIVEKQAMGSTAEAMVSLETSTPSGTPTTQRSVIAGTEVRWILCEATPNQLHATGSGAKRGTIYRVRVKCQKSANISESIGVLIGGVLYYNFASGYKVGASDIYNQQVSAYVGTYGPIKTFYIPREIHPKGPTGTGKWRTITSGCIQTPISGSMVSTTYNYDSLSLT